MTLVFTLCSNNYLAHAVSLGKSLISHHPDYSFRIGLVDRQIDRIDYQSLPFEVEEVDSIGISRLEELVLKYTVRELNTAVKASYFKYFFRQVEENDAVIYLDPDILVFHRFDELERLLGEKDIVLTPHFTTPIQDEKHQQEEDFLNSGLYNLGFIAIKKTTIGMQLVEWWDKRLMDKGFIRFEKGMFTDQIWINFVPLYFQNTVLLNHKGYNVAYWNLHERRLKDTKTVISQEREYPLVFYHFSGYNPDHPDEISKYQDRYTFTSRQDIEGVFKEYRNRLIENGYPDYIRIPCAFQGIKDEEEWKHRRDALRKMPFAKRAMRSVILRLIRGFNIELELQVDPEK